ncbi:hypothetical protein M407DRAFT_17577 [Tulasnella calospora MUT 4182]|uniref:Uncharacterized protein n=1 Tax=Tulasnella calospora MUT 4182 TaxID=1051891 RepID=A0A0C3QLH9_9AGAM|nr:hypothetical protein M407DRAFT_17577 [Tulasnella calospora MUT 4182]
MADNTRPGPLPPKEPGVHPSHPDPTRMARRFARRDPQLYPVRASCSAVPKGSMLRRIFFSQQLAAAVVGILGVGAWFALYKKPAELSSPGAVGGLPHSPETSKSRIEEWKHAPQVHDRNPEKDQDVHLPSKDAAKR